MKIRIAPLFLLLASGLPASYGQEKGVTPIAPSEFPASHSTRAVVVGISDYQSPQIPDLQFADEDAAVFTAWLRSPAGGKISANNLQMLLNDEATLAHLTSALTWIMEESNPGDQAVIYFSGHGDVEVKTDFQLGFLLPWDSPPQNYMAGAYPLFYLQAVVSTMSKKNVRVLLITDACHAGKLAGSEIGGAVITGSNLARQFAKETKILSCAPDEYSMEGKQWGGGRGAFSFYLVNGLCGLADQNRDTTVNLLEIGRYLQDHVSPDVAPLRQTPITVGLPTEKIASVDIATYEKLKADISAQLLALKSGMDQMPADEALAQADPFVWATYRAFKLALLEKRFFKPQDSCAETLFNRLLPEKSFEPIYNSTRLDFAMALQEEPQQALNALLESDPYETTRWQYNPDKYADYPQQLQRSLELLGPEHLAYPSVLAKKLYFEAYLLANMLSELRSLPFRQDSVRMEAKKRLLQGVALQPEAGFLYHGIANLYTSNTGNVLDYQTDSVEKYCRLASRFAPKWLLPWLDLSIEYSDFQVDLARADTCLMQAYQINPKSYLVLERLSSLLQLRNRLDEAIELADKMVALHPDLFKGAAIQGLNYFLKRDYKTAERWFSKSLEIDPAPLNWSHFFLAWLGYRTRRPNVINKHVGAMWLNSPERVHYNIAAFGSQPDSIIYHCLAIPDSVLPPGMQTGKYAYLGKSWFARNDLEKARQACLRSLGLDPTSNALFQLDYAILGAIEGRMHHLTEAEDWFQKALNFPQIYFLEDWQHREEVLFLYARYLLDQNRIQEAEKWFQKTNSYAFERGYLAYYGFALLAAKQGRNLEALQWLEKSLQYYYPRPEPIRHEPLFQNIRKTKRFEALMQKHFPPGWEER